MPMRRAAAVASQTKRRRLGRRRRERRGISRAWWQVRAARAVRRILRESRVAGEEKRKW